MKYNENEWTTTMYFNREESHQKKKLKWAKVSSVCIRGTYRAGKIINKSKELINKQLGTIVNWEGG